MWYKKVNIKRVTHRKRKGINNKPNRERTKINKTIING